MDDLLGDLHSSSNPESAVNKSDLLSFDLDGPGIRWSRGRQTGNQEQIGTLIDFDGTAQPGEASALQNHSYKQAPGSVKTIADNVLLQVGGNTVTAVSYDSTEVKNKSSDVLDDDDDDFGDFVESPNPDTGSFPISIDAAMNDSNVAVVPPPLVLLEYLMDKVLVVPAAFISELASVSYSLKRAILNDQRTRTWLEAMVAASSIAQRIIHGRHRRVDDIKSRRETDIVAQRLAQEWSSNLMPRLSSLSSGSLRLKPMKLNAYNEAGSNTIICKICGCEEEDETFSKASQGTVYGHKSCLALVKQLLSIKEDQ